MKKIVKISVLILISFCSYAQDVLTTATEELKVKVLEITPTEVKYKRFDNLDGPLITVLKKDVAKLVYSNGIVQIDNQSIVKPVKTHKYKINEEGTIVLSEKKPENVSPKPTSVEPKIIENNTTPTQQKPIINHGYDDMYKQGVNDANIYYQNYKGAGTGTLVTSLLLGPVIGLIPAGICSGTKPSSSNLTFPDVQLTKNINYTNGYMNQAAKIKRKKVWMNFAIGSIISVTTIVIVNSQRQTYWQ